MYRTARDVPNFHEIENARKNEPKKSAETSTAAREEGNRLFERQVHNKKIHLDIMSLYTKSAALAPNGSEELALAYGNRSYLLMHLRMYKECLIDIERAEAITKSDKLKMKLLNRRTKCMILADASTEDKRSWDGEKLESYAVGERSKTIPCAYECITVAQNKKYGRHVIATEDIEAGQIIVIEKNSFLLPNNDRIYLNCSHCLMFVCNGIPCESCPVAVYCSEDCRKEAWLQYHDAECKILPFLMYCADDLQYWTPLLAAVRCFIKSVKNEGLLAIIDDVDKLNNLGKKGKVLQGFFDNGLFQTNKFKTFFNLLSNTKDTNSSVKCFQIACIKYIVDVLACKTNIFGDCIKSSSKTSFRHDKLHHIRDIIYHLKLILFLNAFHFNGANCHCESQDECKQICGPLSIGLIFTPFCSLFNHSCDNNIDKLITKNGEMVIYTVQPVKKGQQLFLCYGGSISLNKTSRQEYLKFCFNFDCDCTACKENWPSKLDNDPMNSDWDLLMRKFMEINLLDSLLVENSSDKFLSKMVIKDFSKMIQTVQKIFTGRKAYAYYNDLMNVISENFKKIFGLGLYKISSDC